MKTRPVILMKNCALTIPKTIHEEQGLEPDDCFDDSSYGWPGYPAGCHSPPPTLVTGGTPTEEIDLIALGETKALLVECKWTAKPLGTDILENLERKATLVGPDLGGKEQIFALCARSGFTEQLIAAAERRSDVILFGLSEITA